MINIIVAYSKNRIIGSKGKIPWNIPEDLKLFKEMTLNNVVIMGRKTWESLPIKPLPQRMNVVLTKTHQTHDKVFFSPSLEGAINMSKLILPERDIFIIGGAQIYQQILKKDLVDRVYASEIKCEYEGDVFFPELNNEWEKTILSENDLFCFCEYVKY